jgi:hypothetical protein
MRFRLIDQAKKEFPVHRLCSILGVSQSGYFAWKGRPASRRQGEDMVLLAHIRARFSTSSETYGAPRMHAELADSDEAGHAFHTEAGHLFRFHSGRRSDLKPATFLDLSWVDFDDGFGLEFRSRV